MADFAAGDPYIAVRHSSWAAYRLAATKASAEESYPGVRDMIKACVLGVQYGMGDETLAFRIGKSTITARQLIRAHQDQLSKSSGGWRTAPSPARCRDNRSARCSAGMFALALNRREVALADEFSDASQRRRDDASGVLYGGRGRHRSLRAGARRIPDLRTARSDRRPRGGDEVHHGGGVTHRARRLHDQGRLSRVRRRTASCWSFHRSCAIRIAT